MAIPEQVRRQAMDAVSHYETTAWMRAQPGNGVPVSAGRQFTYPEPARPEVRPIPDHVRQQAMDAVSHPQTQARITLARDHDVFAPATPSRQAQEIAGKIARLRIEVRDVDRAHKEITKDGFGREHG